MTMRSMPAAGPWKCSIPKWKGWGYYEYTRQRAQELEQHDKPQTPKTVYAQGSMEWLAEQNKSS
jgi:hypothetical protein